MYLGFVVFFSSAGGVVDCEVTGAIEELIFSCFAAETFFD
jgi:hypothetical protein